MAEDRFKTQFAALANEDLVRIAQSEPSEFEIEAIEAAKEALAQRSINSDELLRIKSQINSEIKREKGRSEIELSNGQWIFFLIVSPLLTISIGGAIILGMRGYKRKSREALLTIPIGYAIYAVLTSVFLLLL